MPPHMVVCLAHAGMLWHICSNVVASNSTLAFIKVCCSTMAVAVARTSTKTKPKYPERLAAYATTDSVAPRPEVNDTMLASMKLRPGEET
eukprot:Skav229475  [mRNA]  locus=scaffold4865:16024:16293:+ [translate_table: standard]